MHVRRLVKAGQASHTVSLPKAWLDKNNLKKGDTVYLHEKSDREIIVTPEHKEQEIAQKEITITTDKKDIEHIQREITSAYINNYSAINIVGKDLNEKAKDVRKMLHDFVALEIAEQTSNKITAKDLLNWKEISIEKTLRRIDIIIRSMFEDTVKSIHGENLYQSIYFRDFDVNRLYFLMFRILKGALADVNIAAQFNVSNAEILSDWYLVLNLENVADNLKTTCKLFTELGDKITGLEEVYKVLQENYLGALKAYYDRNKDLAQQVASKRQEVIVKLEELTKKNKNINALMPNIKELETFISNIARIVIDRE
ncbi:MAG: AbrB/MazE/SpoVT family DNA-binding domain-containing protein [Candidatus Nanoarchaeia archaeon]|nr:AbrB/MazE/SpoVT family DNA-binding domain-containing protein [Candidatus Nanoarchaeia archaeon]